MADNGSNRTSIFSILSIVLATGIGTNFVVQRYGSTTNAVAMEHPVASSGAADDEEGGTPELRPLREFFNIKAEQAESEESREIDETTGLSCAELREIGAIAKANRSHSDAEPKTGIDTPEAEFSLDYLIATVPDPNESRFGYWFDSAVDAIGKAITDEGYFQDRYDYPWKTSTPGKSSGGDAKVAGAIREAVGKLASAHDPEASPPSKSGKGEGEKPERNHPGVILFRDMDKKRLMVLFLVGETPTWGLHKRAFYRGLILGEELKRKIGRDKCHPASDKIKILGPYFSGTATSMERTIRDWRIRQHADQEEVEVISGSAEMIDPKMFVKECDGAALAPASPTRFHGMRHHSNVTMNGLVDYLAKQEGKSSSSDLKDVVILHEEDTQFGSVPKKTEEYNPLLLPHATFIPFPLHISDIRSAYPKDESKQNTKIPRLDTPLDKIPIPFDQFQEGEDQPPAMERQMSTPIDNLKIGRILQMISRENVRYVGIIASDTRDKIFLIKLIQEYASGAKIFFTNADQLLAYPDFSHYARGAVVGSTYPLFQRNQLWSYPYQGSKQRITFMQEENQGVYNGTRALLEAAWRWNVERGEAAHAGDFGLLEYGPPFEDLFARSGVETFRWTAPPVWISIVGHQGLWPVAVQEPKYTDLREKDDYTNRYIMELRREPTPVLPWKRGTANSQTSADPYPPHGFFPLLGATWTVFLLLSVVGLILTCSRGILGGQGLYSALRQPDSDCRKRAAKAGFLISVTALVTFSYLLLPVDWYAQGHWTYFGESLFDGWTAFGTMLLASSTSILIVFVLWLFDRFRSDKPERLPIRWESAGWSMISVVIASFCALFLLIVQWIPSEFEPALWLSLGPVGYAGLSLAIHSFWASVGAWVFDNRELEVPFPPRLTELLLTGLVAFLVRMLINWAVSSFGTPPVGLFVSAIALWVWPFHVDGLRKNFRVSAVTLMSASIVYFLAAWVGRREFWPQTVYQPELFLSLIALIALSVTLRLKVTPPGKLRHRMKIVTVSLFVATFMALVPSVTGSQWLTSLALGVLAILLWFSSEPPREYEGAYCPLMHLLAMALATATVVGLHGSTEAFANSPHPWAEFSFRHFLIERTVRIGNGVSPILPILFFGAGLAWLGINRLRLTRLGTSFERRPKIECYISTLWGKAHGSIDWGDSHLARTMTKLREAASKPFWSSLFDVAITPFVISVLLLLLQAWHRSQPSVEAGWYDKFYCLLLATLATAIVVSAGRAIRHWLLLHDLWRGLGRLPIASGFDALPTVAIRSFGPYLSAWDKERSEGFKVFIQTVGKRLCDEVEREGGNRIRKRAEDDLAKLACKQLKNASIRLTEAYPPSPDREPSGDEKASPKQAAREYVALRLLEYLGFHLSRLRIAGNFLATAPVLLLLAITSYPAQPQGLLQMIAWGLVLASLAIGLFILVKINSNAFLNRILRTKPGFSIDRDFLQSALGFGIPIVAILVTQIPDLGDMLSDMLDPFYRILR